MPGTSPAMTESRLTSPKRSEPAPMVQRHRRQNCVVLQTFAVKASIRSSVPASISISPAVARPRPGTWTPSDSSLSSCSASRTEKSRCNARAWIAQTNRARARRGVTAVERRRIERPPAARDARGERFDHQRDVGAARAAEGEQGAAQRLSRVRGGLPSLSTAQPSGRGSPASARRRNSTNAAALED